MHLVIDERDILLILMESVYGQDTQHKKVRIDNTIEDN